MKSIFQIALGDFSYLCLVCWDDNVLRGMIVLCHHCSDKWKILTKAFFSWSLTLRSTRMLLYGCAVIIIVVAKLKVLLPSEDASLGFKQD